MNWFKNCKTIDELKAKHKKLAKEFHPDVNPGTDAEIMTDINSQYQQKFEELTGTKKPEPEKPKTENKPKSRKIPKIELSDREQDELIQNLTNLSNFILKIGIKKTFAKK